MGSPNSCQYCRFLVKTSETEEDSSPTTSERDEHFHSKCLTCITKVAPEVDNILCTFCSHLRLQHLLFCSDGPSWSEINFGNYEDIQSRRDCKFCQLVQLAVTVFIAAIKPPQVPTSTLQFTLSFYKKANNPSQYAQVYLTACGDDYFDEYDAFRVYANENFSAVQFAGIFPNGEHVPAGGSIKWDRIRGWLDRCSSQHERCTPSRIGQLPNDFRVIDVQKRQIVQPGPDCRFVALSYVWGRSPDPSKLTATLATIKALEGEGGLVAPDMPSTIEEAIQICVQMKERYLWADRLCIVQDDFESKKNQINCMAGIYASAAFAIVIAYGESMDVKVPGIGLERQIWTSKCNIGDLTIANRLPAFQQTVSASVWSTRGWTFQETVLPSRKLFFTPLQVIYECSAGILHEDNALNEDPEDEFDKPFKFYAGRTVLFKDGSKDVAFDYCRLTSQYNSRLLSYSADIYNAIAGITTALYGTPNSLVHGLPLKDFDQSLLWQPHKTGTYEVRSVDGFPLPSWAWSSVSGDIKYLSFYGSLVKWSLLQEGSTIANLLTIDGSKTEPDEWTSWYEIEVEEKLQKQWLAKAPQIYMTIAAVEGCFEPNLELDIPIWKQTSFPAMGTQMRLQWPDYHDFWSNAFENTPPCPVPTDLNMDNGGKPVLITRAQTAMLRLTVHKNHREYGCDSAGNCYDIVTRDGQHIGILGPSIPLENKQARSEFKQSDFRFIAISISGGVDAQCVFPSKKYEKPRGARMAGSEYIEDKHLDIGYWDNNGTALYPTPVVNVMLLGQRGRLSYRIGVGWVFLKKWAQLARHFETILLV